MIVAVALVAMAAPQHRQATLRHLYWGDRDSTASQQTRLGLDSSELTLANDVHGFDVSDQDARAAKGLEAEHGPGDAFDGSVVLLDDVGQILLLGVHLISVHK